MYYWLFTEGEALVDAFGYVICAAAMLPSLPILTAWWMGADIRRDSAQTGAGNITLRTLIHLAMSLAVTVIYLVLAARFFVDYGSSKDYSGVIGWLIGDPPVGISERKLLIGAVGHWLTLLVVNVGLQQSLKSGGWLRDSIETYQKPDLQRGELGSSHLCNPAAYRRYNRSDPDGITFFGAFWGDRNTRLDRGRGAFCLNGEDAARGIVTLGGPGSGKSQAVILPSIADAMKNGHSVIVGDPQGELQEHVLNFASVTGHLVVIHDPTGSRGPRFNLANDITTVADARAIAGVLVPKLGGDNAFWSESSEALLAACLMCFNSLGEIYSALGNIQKLAKRLSQNKIAALLANSFMASAAAKDPKVATSIVATLSTALTGWADPEVQENTSTSDFDAHLITERPTVVVLTCPGRYREVFAKYLGAVITKLLQDLDSIGEANKNPATRGQLPLPVNLILDEFPQLGRLDRLVADVNLVRKRRISIMIAAQTMGQFRMIYGQDGTNSLLAGMATQIVFGGCDQETADYYSRSSGTATHKTRGIGKDDIRQRALLTSDEVQAPAKGNATIFARYVEAHYALQTILFTRLTRFYERRDWQRALAQHQSGRATLLQRGIPEFEAKRQSSESLSPAQAFRKRKQAAQGETAEPGETTDAKRTGRSYFEDLHIALGVDIQDGKSPFNTRLEDQLSKKEDQT